MKEWSLEAWTGAVSDTVDVPYLLPLTALSSKSLPLIWVLQWGASRLKWFSHYGLRLFTKEETQAPSSVPLVLGTGDKSLGSKSGIFVGYGSPEYSRNWKWTSCCCTCVGSCFDNLKKCLISWNKLKHMVKNISISVCMVKHDGGDIQCYYTELLTS